MTRPRRYIVGITGASGACYAQRLVQLLAGTDAEVHLVVSPLGQRLLHDELGMEGLDLDQLTGGRKANVILHNHRDVGASIASGSFVTDGMAIIPCSSNTLSAVATGSAQNLLHRAAYVTLKERRPLVLVHREMPLTLVDLRNMAAAHEAGAIVCPANPGFYMLPKRLEDVIDFVVARVLDLLKVEHALPGALGAINRGADVIVTSASLPASARFLVLARDIKLSHSVFALPFAVLGGYLASGARGELLHQQWAALLLVVVCMVLARTVAMTVNRLADYRFDARNPRTQGRALPAGRLSLTYMRMVTLTGSLGFVAATAGFWLERGNYWPVVLSPLVLGWLCLYSFTKRFTWLCHVFLGSSLALSPIAATIAIHPAYLQTPTPWLLAGMVLCWVAGFDVIYALQDVEIDRQEGLFSMPAMLGEARALWMSRLLHVGCVAALVLLWRSTPLLGVGFLVGAALSVALLILEQGLVWGSKTHRIDVAFLTVNGVISVLLGALGVFDVWRALG